MPDTLWARVVRRWAVRAVLVTLAALTGLAVLAGPASAHTELLRSDPAQGSVVAAAPAAATLTFNENIRVVSSAVHLYAADGRELDVDPRSTDRAVVVGLPDALGDGTYTVAWRVISADGHPVAGSVDFSVGAPSADVRTPQVVGGTTSKAVQVSITVVQIAVYLGVFMAIGLMVFGRLLLPRGTAAAEARVRVLGPARRGADVGIIASILLLPLTRINQRGDGLGSIFRARSWITDLSEPEPQVAGLVFLGLALCVATYRPGRLGSVAPFAGAAMALGALALVGHTRSFEPVPLMVATDLAHLATGSVWFGGLVGLTISLRHLATAPVVAAQAVSRFSTIAAGLLAAVAVTGSLLAWRILGSWSALVHTSFGRALLVKLGIVAVVVGLAALNRWRLLPAVVRLTAPGGTGTASAAITRLRRAIRVEGVLLVAVLAMTGILVDRSPETPPGAATVSSSNRAAAGPATVDGEAPGIRVRIRVDPGRVGTNALEVDLTDEAGAALTPYEEPELSLVHEDLRLDDQALTGHGLGSYHAEVVLPKPGSWTAELTVRTGEFESRVVPIRFEVTSSGR